MTRRKSSPQSAKKKAKGVRKSLSATPTTPKAKKAATPKAKRSATPKAKRFKQAIIQAMGPARFSSPFWKSKKKTPIKAGSAKKKTPQKSTFKAFDVPKPDSPRVLVEHYRSRGLLEPPVTIDLTVEDISEGDLTLSTKKTTPTRKRKLATPDVAAKRQKQDVGRHVQRTAAGSICITLSSPEPAKPNKTIEDGEIIDDDSIQVLDRPDSPDVQIIEEKAPAKKNPQSIFSRWNFPGLRGANVVDADGNKKNVEAENLKTKKRKPFKTQFIRHDRYKKKQQQLQNPDQAASTSSTWLRPSRTHEGPTWEQHNVPVFDPEMPPNIRFTAEIGEVPREVFAFNAAKPNFPRMGVRVSRSRLARPISPLASTSIENAAFFNVHDASAPTLRRGLRPIVIDGSNVAFAHSEASHLGSGKRFVGAPVFSSRGIDICVEYFKRLGHQHIIAFVPHHRQRAGQAKDGQVLQKLKNNGNLSFTPDKTYDDRYVIQYAAMKGGVVVSNDTYRDLLNGDPAIDATIRRRRLPFTFVGDVLMFPEDPEGRGGKNLAQFLSF